MNVTQKDMQFRYTNNFYNLFIRVGRQQGCIDHILEFALLLQIWASINEVLNNIHISYVIKISIYIFVNFEMQQLKTWCNWMRSERVYSSPGCVYGTEAEHRGHPCLGFPKLLPTQIISGMFHFIKCFIILIYLRIFMSKDIVNSKASILSSSKMTLTFG